MEKIKKQLSTLFSTLLVAGLMAGCASVADPGIDINEPEESAVTTDAPVLDPWAGDEMTPIITDSPRGGR